MYFPYLRGRQYELIALRELLQRDILHDHIIPIIEPVKLSSTLISTLRLYQEKKRAIALIINPQVGKFMAEYHNPKNQEMADKFGEIYEDADNMFHAIILSKDAEVTFKKMKPSDKILTICNKKDGIKYYDEIDGLNEHSLYNLILDESSYRRNIRKPRVLLNDSFNKQDRNADYMEVEDEIFSEDHLYYLEEGYAGFADYSVIGAYYTEGGFAPYAVAIHIVYFDSKGKGVLRIHHFVSDSNDDIHDVVGKFSEAMEKLVSWKHTHSMDTYGIGELVRLYREESYPGLGTVKKLTVMHHLELIGQYLGREAT